MATVLALSSMVARGHVGLGAIVPALQRLGHEVIALPTIMLSNHPAHRDVARLDVPASKLEAMLDAIEANGWLAGVDAIITGYLPTVAHVEFAGTLVARVRARQPGAIYFCDPVMGDLPRGLYIDDAPAQAIAERLIGKADYLTPNLFELQWLSGRPVDDMAAVVDAARSLPAPVTLVTSVPISGDQLANVLVSTRDAWRCAGPRLDAVPHGTGDFLTARFAAECLDGRDLAGALGAATASVSALVSHSAGRDELALVPAQDAWLRAPSIPASEI
jgi:pyridoxine kinase